MLSRISCFVFAILLSGFSFTVFSQTLAKTAEKSVPVRDIKVDVSMKDAPHYTVDSGSSPTTKSDQWLIVDVTYLTGSSASNTDIQYIDNMEVSIEILIPTMYGGRKTYALLTGKPSYWAIAMDGKKHKAEGFIPPQIVKRFIRPEIKSSVAKEIYVSVSFTSGGNVLCPKTYYFNGRTEFGMNSDLATGFSRVKESLPPKLIIRDSIYSRKETPWLLISSEMNELLKTTDNSGK